MNTHPNKIALGFASLTLLSNLACDSDPGTAQHDRTSAAILDSLVFADSGLRSSHGDDLLIDDHLVLTFTESEDQGLTLAVDMESIASYWEDSHLELEAIVHLPDGARTSVLFSTDRVDRETALLWAGLGRYEVEFMRLTVDGEVIIDEPFAWQQMTIMNSEVSSAGVNALSARGSTAAGSTAACGSGSTINGSVSSDVLNGTSNNDVINGKAGNDTIYGGGCNDELFGGAGTDTIYGDSGDDDIYGGLRKDTLYGGDGDDFIDGGPGADVCVGGPGNDVFVSCSRVQS